LFFRALRRRFAARWMRFVARLPCRTVLRARCAAMSDHTPSAAPRSQQRRRLLQAAAALPFTSAAAQPQARFARVRPGTVGWPSPAEWQGLRAQVSGRLVQLQSPWTGCIAAPTSEQCARLFRQVGNPYFISDDPALTQALGWVDAWTSAPSTYAVEARSSADVAAAVNFAREHRLRLVVKGGGHSYQGTSSAPDSLLVWTHGMREIQLHDAFLPQGCAGRVAPAKAASLGAGALWVHAYDSVTTRGGRYVQGGGCMTVGVAGLVQSGGFGSFSKRFGTAAGNLLEAQVVTADGVTRIANACTNPDLFWALKGGGGGSFGVVTRLTVRTHDLPETFGAVNFTVHAASAAAFRRLAAMTLDFYAGSLMNPHWGEQIRFLPGNVMRVQMVFQGMERGEAVGVLQPFLDALGRVPDLSVDFAPLKIVSTSAREFWSPTFMKRALGFIKRDARPGAPEGNVYWPGDEGQAGQVLHGYASTWLPASLLQPAQRASLADALAAAGAQWGVSLHFNKGLAGAPADAIAAARDTAMNPAALDAFALAITAAHGPAAYPGVAGHEPDRVVARQQARRVRACMAELRKLVPQPGSYVSESDYFEPEWQNAFWGGNYARLRAVKAKYDPEGLFLVHHGVGSEQA
jgi:FAD/FMN-containing dehydrogenase